jgi:hypothetical protein
MVVSHPLLLQTVPLLQSWVSDLLGQECPQAFANDLVLLDITAKL